MLSRVFSCALLAFAAINAHAQPFPNKPIRLIAPFPPGGEIDLVARGLGQKMTESMGQPVVVENVAGAAGAIGSERVAKSAADGYTILLGATTTHAINPALNAKLSYDAVKDFTPISLVTTIPHVLVVNAAVPATTLAEFVKLVQGEVEAVGRLHSDWMTHFKARPLQLTLMRMASEPALLAGEAALKLRTGEYEVYGALWSNHQIHFSDGHNLGLALACRRRDIWGESRHVLLGRGEPPSPGSKPAVHYMHARCDACGDAARTNCGGCRSSRARSSCKCAASSRAGRRTKPIGLEIARNRAAGFASATSCSGSYACP